MTNPNDPFGGNPFFGDLSRLIGAQGAFAWDAANQLAAAIATEGVTEANVDPLERIRIEELARIVEVQVNGLTGLDVTAGGPLIQVEPVTRSLWAHRTLVALRPRFEAFAESIKHGQGAPGTDDNPDHTPSAQSEPPVPGLEDLAGLGDELKQFDDPVPDGVDDDPFSDPASAWLGNMLEMLSPMLLGMTAGSLVGHLSQTSFGVYDVPLPRPLNDPIMIIPASIDRFAQEWSLDPEALRLAVLAQELTHHAILGLPHIRERFDALLEQFAQGFQPDPDALERHLSEFDPTNMQSITSFQQVMGDPEILLGATSTADQQATRVQLDALLAVIVGYVEHIGAQIGARLIADHGRIGEALKRARVSASDADRFVQQLFGLNLDTGTYERGAAFIDGVTERAGDEALAQLWSSAATLPTPAEVDAPGLWLARLEFEN